ncbi:DNA polymerase III subunit beta [Micromonosporaceae bacterium B7E4]
MTATLARGVGLACRANPRALSLLITRIAKYVPARPTAPVMGGILLEVDVDGRLTATGYDYDTAARARIDVDDPAPGRALVSGRLLDALVKTFPDKPVDLAITDTTLNVRCGGLRLTLPLMVVDDYPTLPEMPATVGRVDAAEFGRLVTRTVPAADLSTKTGRAVLHGVHVGLGADLEMVASDGYRIAEGRAPWRQAGPVELALTIPGPALAEVGRTLDGPGDLTIGYAADSGVVGFATDDGQTVVTRLIAEEWPIGVLSTIPELSGTPATVGTTDLAMAIKRAEMVRADKTASVALTFTAGQVSVAGAGDATTGEDIECRYDGPDLTIHVNPHYFTDALAGLRDDTAVISITDPLRPVVLTSPSGGEQAYRHVIMPIRLR